MCVYFHIVQHQVPLQKYVQHTLTVTRLRFRQYSCVYFSSMSGRKWWEGGGLCKQLHRNWCLYHLYFKICIFGGFYAAENDRFLPTFRDTLSVPSSKGKQYKTLWTVRPFAVSPKRAHISFTTQQAPKIRYLYVVNRHSVSATYTRQFHCACSVVREITNWQQVT